ncbi:hypothetical protein L873DRAFT_380061 [Choiromyces venosus 120613-1]|uniref:Uncharacterized protein n=1 Tax=Choiromyces venosus 120613-1 TaxID=1336337 RepID=A0A3N4IXD7_9PEZI|nr:hypothetical protein L873DRAFT_380061 [Choiromyces venosus 120613-1]
MTPDSCLQCSKQVSPSVLKADGGGRHYCKNFNNWTVCYVVGLSSLSKVKKLLFFFLSWNREGLCFCCIFYFLTREGNFGLHSTPSNYSSFYGMICHPVLSWSKLSLQPTSENHSPAVPRGKCHII